MIPFYKPNITELDIAAVSDVLRSGKLTTGEKASQFEKEFAEYIGAPYVLVVDSLTSGFLLLVDFLTPKVASLPSATYISMANTLKKFGVRITFTDEWCVGKEYPIVTDKGIIWDSAHRIVKDIFKQSPEDYWLFSFHATKLITSGTGGAIAIPSRDHYEYLRTLRDSGRLRGAKGFDYLVPNAGWNLYMSDVAAALGLSQLQRIDELIKAREDVTAKYKAKITNLVTSQYLVQFPVKNLDAFASYAKKNDIQVSHHFRPIHLQPAYFTGQTLPKTEQLSAMLISLPYYPHMPDEEINEVSKLVIEWRGQ